MPKLSKEEKLKLVRRHIGGHCVPTPEGYRSRTAFKASLLAWAKRYRMYGGERAGTEGEDGSRSLGQGRGCPALPLRREKQGPGR